MLLSAIYDVAYLIQVGVDFVRQLVEVAPLLAKLWRFMGRPQQILVLPLDIIDDAPPIEAAMQANGNESGLARHEAGSLSHQCQCLGLLLWFGLDDRDLSYGLIVDLDMGHGRPRLIGKWIAVSPLALNELARAIVHPIDFARHDEIILMQSFYLLGAQGNRHITPTEVDVGVMAFGFGELTDPLRKGARFSEIAESKGPLDAMGIVT